MALNASMFASPVFWIVAAIVALVAVVVLIATKTDWFQQAWSVAWGFIKSTTDTVVAGIGSVLNWFGSLPGKLGGWFGSAKDAAIRKLLELHIWLTGLPGRAASALAGLPGSLRRSAVTGFQAFRTAAGQKASDFIAWVRGMPRRIASGIGSLASLLTGKGRDVVRGLWNGIKGMGGWIKDKLISWAKAMIPGPIADALGINSPSRVMAQEIGQWIPAGVVDGIEAGQGAVDRSMRNLVSTPTPGQATAAAMAAQTSAATGGAGAGGGRIVIDVTGADGEWKRVIRRMVRVDGRGSVQTAFGT
ncbi:phage tail protein [Streptomyces sp. BA2]|uniref:phage tail protein n=1 Tax=Streptomyces sp. BA2 TaxID=436595 RepID=UPI001328C4E0|nr:hypothetical protein [Streptomyces sp. BA2]MWA12572.1 hypothetical protein [Streptomyces sp. BA2]